VPAVPLASSFTDSLGLIVVFAVVFPALVTGLIVFIIAQVLGERRENRNARYDRPQNE
jgi:phage shock protein PspC (stress-responsive transcriptional regulator)